MNIKNNFISFTALLISLLSLGLALFYFFSTPKIAYCNNGQVLSKYVGLKEIKNSYDIKVKNWQSNLDTLSSDFNREVQEFSDKSSKMPSAEKKAREELLQQKEKELFSYKQALEHKAIEEEQELTAGIVNQVNAFVQEYGKQHGYDLILGSTDNGNILFAKESNDITDELVEYINKRYKGL
jgi:outer membrane protein